MKTINYISVLRLISFKILLWLIVCIQTGESQQLIFNHLTVEDGLSNNNVNIVIQDRTGFIWFGTEDGLDRYDGYNFKVFRHDSPDTNSISDNCIWTLMEDSRGYIWIGTKSGVIDRYDPVMDRFAHLEIKSPLTEENSITSFYEDSRGNIWTGTYKDGLYKIDASLNIMEHFRADINNSKSLSHNYVQDIIEDLNGRIIVGTYIGLNILDPNSPEEGFKRFYHNPDDRNSISNNLIWSLTRSSSDSNVIWIGTVNNLTKFYPSNNNFKRIEIPNPDNLQYGTSCNTVIEENTDGDRIIYISSYSGLMRMNLNTGALVRYVSNEENTRSIINNQVNKVIRDRSGVLWIVTQDGISYTTPKSKSFNSVDLVDADFNPLKDLKKKNITALGKSSDSRIWIGSSDGLYSLDLTTVNRGLRKIHRFDGYNVWSLESFDEQRIWIGTFGKGLSEFNYIRNTVRSRDVDDPRVRTDSRFYNKTLLPDSRKNIWVGYWGVGAARINAESGKTDVWLNEPGNDLSLSHNDVWVIKEDHFGRIWLGTAGGGLNLFEDRSGGIFHRWLHNENIESSISSNNIYSILEAKQTKSRDDSVVVLWIGTSNGLNRFEIKNIDSHNIYDINIDNHFYTIKDGLPDNSVNAIAEDDRGNLWLGTGSGISFFDVKNNKFTNFTAADGINGTMINTESVLKLADGLILFGSTKGLNIFDPDNIRLSSYKPNLVITDFKIFNESAEIGNDSPLKKSILNTHEIVLSNSQNVFSIEYAALDYNSPGSIEYAYKMEGFDENWIKSGNRRFVTYTNLDPGDYIFKVKSTNADGVWNDQTASLKIIMRPPWWKTYWAFGVYLALILMGLLTIRRVELNRTKLRNELKLREFEVKQKSELEELKSRFFANLSHEFRTPLMLIKGPLEQLKKDLGPGLYEKNLDLIERNSNRLKKLIDQLLELSQLEKAAIPLRTQYRDLIISLKGCVSNFEEFAGQKNISLEVITKNEPIYSWFDNEKFEKIINNLLSNAVKYTPPGGFVRVYVDEYRNSEKPYAEIIVSDSGVGIPGNKVEKVFDRFFQAHNSEQDSYSGSGIGLALVKELIDLHKWQIDVRSEQGKGTEFKIKIPLWEDYLSENEKIRTVQDNLPGSVKQMNSSTETPEYESVKSKSNKRSVDSENKPSVLVVDDSEDVRIYLSELLEDKYLVSEAEDGEEGIKKAAETMPDIIISDVMMPSMDGMEFCRRIKSEWQTSDIPVILLTAKASIESRLEGFETGADEYLIKPFNSVELFTRIKNLLGQRERLKSKYSNDLMSENFGKGDKEFLAKTIEIIETNMDKTEFKTESLARELFMSRTQLHRKILAITGNGPGELVRTIKLKRAAELLLQGELSITQISYEIGFSSPAQFTRAFSKYYRCLPSEYPSGIALKK